MEIRQLLQDGVPGAGYSNLLVFMSAFNILLCLLVFLTALCAVQSLEEYIQQALAAEVEAKRQRVTDAEKAWLQVMLHACWPAAQCKSVALHQVTL
jgi:hypothetical protein